MLELNEIHNPFPGIRPFEMDETNLFFGRDGQSDELLKRMQRTRLLAVVGTSGSGKSSLIRAGLLPALYGGLMGDAGSSWRIAIQRPGGDPIGNLAIALADPLVFGSESNSEIQTALIETTLRRSSIGLIDVARQARMSEHENLLVVVDQFEELFRFKQSQSSDDATTFVKLLLEVSAQQEIPIYIIITMRSDFLGDCSQFTGLPEAINNGQYLIPRMSRDERQSAIVGPIAVGEGQISAPLVSRLLNDVGDNPDQLPILQHALMRTWGYWAAHRRNGAPIGLDDYTAIGTMAEALSRHADEAFNELDERSQLIAEKLFKRLTEKGADNREIRRPTPLAELCAVCEASETEVTAIIDVFRGEGRSFLMPPVGTRLTSETVIDISHESLIRNWARLQKWVDEEAQSSRTYRRLAEAEVLHREGSEGLLQDPGLQVALDWFEKNKPNAAWARRYHPEFEAAKLYLTNSCEAREAAERERERQRNAELDRERREREQAELYAQQQQRNAEQQLRTARRLRRFSFALVFISILALAAAGGAVFLFVKAKQSESTAREEQKKSHALAAALYDYQKQLEGKSKELQESVNAYKDAETERIAQTNKAKDSAAAAHIAEKKAEAEAQKARDGEIKARTAQNLAMGNAQRGQLAKDTLESMQRKDYMLAAGALETLITSLKSALKSGTPDLQRRLNLELAWAYAHAGSAVLALSELEPSGNIFTAVEEYETAYTTVMSLGNKQQDDPTDPEPIKYETYNGLAKTYQTLGLIGLPCDRGPIPNVPVTQTPVDKRPLTDANLCFTKAEDLYRKALSFHEDRLARELNPPDRGYTDDARLAVEARGVAEGHLNLARLYRSIGEEEKAQQQFKAVEQLPHIPSTESAQARRELAELYRDQKKYAEAVAVYKNLILRQEQDALKEEPGSGSFTTSAEPVTIEGFARFAPEIATSYNQLADLYRSWAEVTNDKAKAEEMTRRVDAAAGLSIALDHFAVRLGGSSEQTDRDDLADALGDAFLRFDKGYRAVLFYQYALEVRKTGSPADQLQVARSYDKLGNFYRSQKDYIKAEQNFHDEIAFYKTNTQSVEYAKAVRDLATVYAENPDSSSELAVMKYREALKIYQGLHDWYGEDLVLYRLTKYYEKLQQPDARLLTLQERVTALAPYFEELVAGTFKNVDDGPKLITEYLQAVNVLGYVLAQSDDVARAEAAYQRAWDIRKYVSTNIKFMKNDNNRSLYDAMLGEYQHLLSRQQKTALVNDVRDFRDRFNRADERSKVVQASAK